MWGTPKDLEPYEKAYKIRRQVDDENMWLNNLYAMHAVSVAIGNSFSKNKKAKYIETPLLQKEKVQETQKKGFSDAEKFEMWAIAYNTRKKRDEWI